MFWGGRFNPIITVDDVNHAKQLAELFHVDVLYAVEPDPAVDAFVAANSHVAWPLLTGPLLMTGTEAKGAVNTVPKSVDRKPLGISRSGGQRELTSAPTTT